MVKKIGNYDLLGAISKMEEEYKAAELDLRVTKAIVFIPVSKNEK
ncbi:hypothetical protein [Clostridium paraputrificum]|nr:hypothetical protein [Clostridium paraputrificum]MDB2108448.1 hypothetical protein [Clostridium paraputrificum]MDB2115329.1 hypothetical protein [Clostridium paraputrificum]